MKTLRFYVGIGGRAFARRRVSRTVARYYPGGFTLQSGRGSWRAPSGRVTSEAVLIVTVCNAPDSGKECAAALAAALTQDCVLVTGAEESMTLITAGRSRMTAPVGGMADPV